MKRYCLLSLMLVLIISGCTGPQQNSDKADSINENTEPKILQTDLKPGNFPASLAGHWKSDINNWIMTVDEQGNLTIVRHVMGVDVNVKEGGLVMEKDGRRAIVALGECKTYFYPGKKKFDVSIHVEHFLLEHPAGTLEGEIKDYFKGTISEDGDKWFADWYSYAWLKGAGEPDFKHIEANPVRINFKRHPIK